MPSSSNSLPHDRRLPERRGPAEKPRRRIPNGGRLTGRNPDESGNPLLQLLQWSAEPRQTRLKTGPGGSFSGDWGLELRRAAVAAKLRGRPGEERRIGNLGFGIASIIWRRLELQLFSFFLVSFFSLLYTIFGFESCVVFPFSLFLSKVRYALGIVPMRIIILARPRP